VRPPRKGFGETSAELDNIEWHAIQPLLPKSRGIKRVDDRRVLNGILWRLRTGRSWAAIPPRYGPPTTCQTRFVRWRDAGVWARIVAVAIETNFSAVHLISAENGGVPSTYRRGQTDSNDVVVWTRSAHA